MSEMADGKAKCVRESCPVNQRDANGFCKLLHYCAGTPKCPLESGLDARVRHGAITNDDARALGLKSAIVVPFPVQP